MRPDPQLSDKSSCRHRRAYRGLADRLGLVRADRRSYLQYGLTERAALETEWYNWTGTFKAEGAAGVARFARGDGRHGDFGDLARPRH